MTYLATIRWHVVFALFAAVTLPAGAVTPVRSEDAPSAAAPALIQATEVSHEEN